MSQKNEWRQEGAKDEKDNSLIGTHSYDKVRLV